MRSRELGLLKEMLLRAFHEEVERLSVLHDLQVIEGPS